MTDFSRLEADIAAQTAVTNSVVTLLGTLSGMIANLKTVATEDPTVQAHIDQLAALVEANKAKLAAAVVANTPAAAPTQTASEPPAQAPDAAPSASTAPTTSAT